MKNLLLASTSTLHSGAYLTYLFPALEMLFADIDEIVFIPFARPGGISHDAYTAKVVTTFQKLDIDVKGLHTFEDPRQAIAEAKAIFTGGGNTFVLVHALHTLQLMQPLREALLNGTPYLGTSAGSNICGPSMQTTNDMPIVYPPSFKTLGMIGGNINAHYLDPDPNSTHMGETRETRIREFHTQNTIPVIGLREGSWLRVQHNRVYLKGSLSARMFLQGKTPFEIENGTQIEYL